MINGNDLSSLLNIACIPSNDLQALCTEYKKQMAIIYRRCKDWGVELPDGADRAKIIKCIEDKLKTKLDPITRDKLMDLREDVALFKVSPYCLFDKSLIETPSNSR